MSSLKNFAVISTYCYPLFKTIIFCLFYFNLSNYININLYFWYQILLLHFFIYKSVSMIGTNWYKCAGYLNKHHTSYLANKLSGLLIAFNYRLLPVGSFKNIVYCSPGNPSNLKCGYIINFVFAPINKSLVFIQSFTYRHKPKWGTGTSSPSTGLK